MNAKILAELRAELKKHVDSKYKIGALNYFKEKITLYGVRSPEVKKISALFFQKLPNRDKKTIFAICEKLWQGGRNEEENIAANWTWRIKKQIEEKDFPIFEKWVSSYVGNWASCDDFCCHSLGELIFRSPNLCKETEKWTKSPKLWLRRASAVCLIYSLRRKKALDECFKIADTLLNDAEDLVQKGYGWMLKEAYNEFPEQIIKYISKNRLKMPRVALRYAIEKMPEKIRKEMLKKI